MPLVLAVLLSMSSVAGALALAQDRQAVPREGSQQSGSDKDGKRRVPPKEGKEGAQPARRTPPAGEQRRAQPRPQPRPQPQNEAQRRRAEPRREPPRRTEIPKRYLEVPRRYHFPPVDLRLGFYYHPYFGFYYGPYYGPYYPYPGPARPVRYSEGALRLKVKPVETEVYVNGYYAGIVDDFDGVFQRLYLPAGEHQIVLRLAGYETFALPVRVPLGDTLDITHQMRRLLPGERELPPPAPRALPPAWTEPPPDESAGSGPDSPYGTLALRTDPVDAQIVVDGQAWAGVAGQSEFVLQLPAGWHELEVRREGYQTFSTRVELAEGQTTRLQARLVRR